MLIEKPIVRQFVKFCIVGASSTLVDKGTLYALLKWAEANAPHVPWWACATLSFCLAVTNGFFWNRRWTFQAGAHGKDTKGLYRVHQFTKIEQVVFCVPDENVAEEEHFKLLGNAEAILAKLYPLASSYQVRVDREMTTFGGRTHRDNLEKFNELLTDALLHPAFTTADFERVRSDALNEIEKEGPFHATVVQDWPGILDIVIGQMEHYKDTPQRKLAQQAPKAETKVPLENWCYLNEDREGTLPIDDKDGGCDCSPACKQARPWTRQIETLEIHEGDAITDSREAYDLAVRIQRHYRVQLRLKGLEPGASLRAYYDEVRLGILGAILRTTPAGYRASDARFLMGSIYWKRGRPADAVRVWREMTVTRDDSYVTTYTDILDVLGAGIDPAADPVAAVRVDGILAAEHQRWLKFSAVRLKQFGYAADSF